MFPHRVGVIELKRLLAFSQFTSFQLFIRRRGWRVGEYFLPQEAGNIAIKLLDLGCEPSNVTFCFGDDLLGAASKAEITLCILFGAVPPAKLQQVAIAVESILGHP